MASVIALFYRRLKATDLSLLWLLAVLFFAWDSNKFIYGFGNFWGASFSSGILWLQFPYTLIALLGLGLFLAVYEPSDAEVSSRHRFAWRLAGSMVPVILIVSSYLFAAMVGHTLRTIFPIAAVVTFLSSLSYIALVSSNGGGRDTPTNTAVPRSSASVTTRRHQFGTRKA